MERQFLCLYIIKNMLNKYSPIILIGFNLVTLLYIISNLGRGFDFTDEGFYLLWIDSPYSYSGSLTLFGYFFHPIYLLLNKSVFLLRTFNILVVYSLTTTAFYLILNKISINKIITIALSTSLSFTSLSYNLMIVATPNYNSLTLIASLFFVVSILLINDNSKKNIGWILVVVAIWLAFLGKATTAAGLTLLTCILAIIQNKLINKNILYSLVTAVIVFLLSFILTDFALFDLLKSGLQSKDILVGHTNEIIRIESYALPFIQFIQLVVFSLFFTILCWASTTTIKYLQGWWLTSLIGAPLLIYVYISYLGYTINWFTNFNLVVFYLIVSFPIVMLLIVKNKIENVEVNVILYIFTLLAIPYVIVLGTNNSYNVVLPYYVVFIVMALFYLIQSSLKNISIKFTIPIVILFQFISISLINYSWDFPYRQDTKTLDQNTSIDFGKKGGVLFVDKNVAEYISKAKSIATKAGFKNNDTIIDLTGQSPGLVYALGGRGLSTPWILGGYKGSNDFAIYHLSRASCEQLTTSWVLLENDESARGISKDVLKTNGLDINTDYENVGELLTAPGVGGYKNQRKQYLYKPKTNLLEKCINYRKVNIL